MRPESTWRAMMGSGSASVKILVVGFGPFVGVAENPAAALARGVDGLRGPALEVVGRELPVSYARAPELTREWASALAADLVLGIGVASRRVLPQVERFGRRRAGDPRADADGERLTELAPDGPDVFASPASGAVARALGVGTSDDAGVYVCNAWLYRTLRSGLPVAFLHVPPAGFPAAQLESGLRALALAAATPGSSS
jgi:pyroglutamyl-peptidase